MLRQIAKGQKHKMIARKLGITEGTVKVHVKNLLHKLGLRSRVEAAVWVLENGRKVEPPPIARILCVSAQGAMPWPPLDDHQCHPREALYRLVLVELTGWSA